MLPRFYVPDVQTAEHVIDLPEDEAAHLTRVLRLTSGDAIRIFDGRGREWHAVVDGSSKRRVTVRIEHEVAPLAEPGIAITLGVAVLKGDKMDAVVRDAVMLGARAIQPLLTERTEVTAAVIERGARITRWQRIAVASAKQCGRAVVPVVNEALPFSDALHRGRVARSVERGEVSERSGTTHDETTGMRTLMLTEPQAAQGARPLREVPRSAEVFLLIGPEGGWTAGEVEQMQSAGAMLVTLGAQVLRADAMPIVAMTALRVAFGDL